MNVSSIISICSADFFSGGVGSRSMDPAHIGGDMSPLYVPRKRKPVQSQARSSPPCPGKATKKEFIFIFLPLVQLTKLTLCFQTSAVQRFPDRRGELHPFENPEVRKTNDCIT